jgi:hypothetical protein
MGNSLSPIVCDFYMVHFEKLALDSALLKPSCWYRYVDDTFVIWPHGSNTLQDFFIHLNSIKPSIQFTMEIEDNTTIPFLDVMVTKTEATWSTRVYRKPTHSGHYLNYESTTHQERPYTEPPQKSHHHMPKPKGTTKRNYPP